MFQLTNPKFQAFDDNGRLLVGGKLYTYASLTDSELVTYSNYAKTSENTNPLILDARGEAVIYGTGPYKFILKDSDDVTIWTLDPVSPFDQSDGIYTPEYYGALGGSNDDTEFVQEALDAGAGQTILFSQKYYITEPLVLPEVDNTTIIGRGWGTGLTTDQDIELITNTRYDDAGINYVTIRDTSFANTYPVVGGVGATKFHIHLINPVRSLIDNCAFLSAFTDSDYHTNNKAGIWLEKDTYYSIINRINQCFIPRGCVRIDSSDSSITNSFVWGHTGDYAVMLTDGDINVLNCGGIIGGRTYGAVYIATSAGAHKICNNYFGGKVAVDGVWINDNGYGVYAENPYCLVINGNTFVEHDKAPIYCSDGLNVTITGNVFENNSPQPIEDHDGYPEIILDGVNTVPSGYTITGNVFSRPAPGGGNLGDSLTDAIHLQGANAPYNNTIVGNIFYGPSRFNSPAVNQSVHRGNIMTGNFGCGTDIVSDTFTPTLKGSGGGTAVCSTEDGYYSMGADGRIYFDIQLITTSIDGLSGDLFIDDIPFTFGYNASIAISQYSGLTLAAGYTQIAAETEPLDNFIRLIKSGSTKTAAYLTVSEAAAATTIKLSGSCITIP